MKNRIINLLALILIAVESVFAFLVVSDWKNFWFMKRRPDLIEKARLMEQQEQLHYKTYDK